MKNKWFYSLIIGIMIFAMNPYFSFCIDTTTEEDTNESISNDVAKLTIGRNEKIPVFKAGEEVRFAIPIENTSVTTARNVFVSPVIEDLKDFPFEMEKITVKKKISSISGHAAKDAIFYPTVAKNAESKIYPIKFNINYTNDFGSESSFTDTIYIKIDNDYKEPSLTLNKVEFAGDKLLGGKTTPVELDIKNDGDLMVKDIEVCLSGFTSNGLTLDGSNDTQNIKSIEGKYFYQVPFKIHVDPKLESGTYTLDLSMKYKDEYNKEYKKETKIYLPIEDIGSQEIDFSFENLMYPEDGVEVNDEFSISFQLKNLGMEEAKYVKVSVDGGSELLPKSPSVQNIRSLSPGKSQPLEFKFFAKEGTESKNYPIKISVEYELQGGKAKTTQSVEQYVGVFVKDTKSRKLTPKIIIDDYNYGGEYVQAGKIFPLALSFYNTNDGKDVRNIKISLSSEGEIFSPVDSSNSFFIEKIKPKGKVQKIIRLKPKADGEYKTHNITATIEYEDNLGNKYNTTETIGIPVIQEVKLVTAEIDSPTENYLGSQVGISLDFYNIGRAKISNMMIHVEGDFQSKDGSVYIGDLEAGKDNYYDTTIIPEKEGTLPGKIIFEYDDEIGEHYTLEKNFNIDVIKEEVPMVDPSLEMEQNKASGSKQWVFGIIGAVLLGGGIFYRKRKKKKEEVALDE